MCARTKCRGRVLIDRARGMWDCRYVRMSCGTTPAGWSSAESVLNHVKQRGLPLKETRAPDSLLSPAVVLAMLRENATTVRFRTLPKLRVASATLQTDLPHVVLRPRSNGRGDQPQSSATVKPHFWLSIDPHEPSKTLLERFWEELRESLSSASVSDKRSAP
jgi:hypothetical protein